MMLTHKISIQPISIFIIFIVSCSACQSCSSIAPLNTLSSQVLSQFSQGCNIESQDQFSIELPLLNPSESQKLSQIHLNLNNGIDNLHVNIIPAHTDNNYELEVIFNDERDIYSLPAVNQAILLTVSQGVYSISFKNSFLKLSNKLPGDLPYTLSIQLPSEDLPSQSFTAKKEASMRFLSGCEQGYFLVEGTCMRVCPAKQFSNNGECTKCADKCYTGRCISEKMCNPCKSNEVFSKELNTCVEKCPETFFEDYNNKICVKCSEGCKTCSFPNGLCSASYFKTDMIINLIVSVTLLSLITLFACLCNKDKPEAPKEGNQDKQGEQIEDQKADQMKKVEGEAPYYVVPENFNFEDEEEASQEDTERRPKKRLTEYAKSKLLSISLHKKNFMIDDADEEKAISHGSASKLSPKMPSISCLTSKTNSPLFKSKRRNSKNTPQSTFKRRSHADVDGTMTPQQNSYGELASPYSAGAGVSALVAKKDTSLGLMAAKKKNSVDAATLNLDTEEDKEKSENRLDILSGKSPLDLPDLDKTPTTVQEAEENEELEDIEEEEMQEKEGYKCDLSVSESKETEGVDFTSCNICNLNTRDCVNKPCGHMVGCYACMEQFRESYGVCPRCKNLLVSLERVQGKKKK